MKKTDKKTFADKGKSILGERKPLSVKDFLESDGNTESRKTVLPETLRGPVRPLLLLWGVRFCVKSPLSGVQRRERGILRFRAQVRSRTVLRNLLGIETPPVHPCGRFGLGRTSPG
jgi:hypothetical protein